MLNLQAITRAAIAAAVLAMVPATFAEDKKALEPVNLQRFEESARTPEEYRELARLYQMRVEMLEEKAAKHDKLEQRYASVPKSLIAKRGYAWNTPRRQADMAKKARRDAEAAREQAETHLASADKLSVAVD